MKKLILIISMLVLFCNIADLLKADDSINVSNLRQGIASDFSNAVISGDNVNVREKPDTSSKILKRLMNKTKITVVSASDEPVFVDKYFGVWLKIELPGKKYGYVFSSFVKSASISVEPFHLFFEKFKKSWSQEDMKSISENIKFPLVLETSFEGEVETSSIEKKNFFMEVRIKEPYMYKMTFEKKSDTVITVTYGYEAVQYTLYFCITDSKWMLTRIRRSQD